MLGVFSESSVMKSKIKTGQDKKLDKVPTKTIVKVIPENKPQPKKVENTPKLSESSTTLKSGKSSANLSKSQTPEMRSSKSSNNLNKEAQIKNILATGKPADKVLKEIMEATEINADININSIKNTAKIAAATKKVTFKDDLQTKSVQLKGKPPAKAPPVNNLKGGKSTTLPKKPEPASRSKSPMVKAGMKKGVSTTNLQAKGAVGKNTPLSKNKSTTNINTKAPLKNIPEVAEPKKEEKTPFMLKGMEININPALTKSMDVKLIYLLLEAKGIIIQRNFRRSLIRKRIKQKKIQRLFQLIRMNIAKRIFTVVWDKIEKIKNVTHLNSLIQNILEKIKRKAFLFHLGTKHDYIADVVRIQRKYKRYCMKKLSKDRYAKLRIVYKLMELKIINNYFLKMKTICSMLKIRNEKLMNLFNIIDTKVYKSILRNNLKNLQNTNRKIKAVTKLESIYLYNLINQYGDNQQKYFTINKIIIRDEDEEGYIDNLKKDAFVEISNFVKGKIKNFLITQYMLHSLEGGVFLVSRRIKLIFSEMFEKIINDKYFINFDENKDLGHYLAVNEYNKIKFRTKNYFLLNIFKIQKTFLEYHYSHTKRQNRKLLAGIVLNKSRKEKKILERYFKLFKMLTTQSSSRSEVLLEKALKILNRNREYDAYLSEKELKLKKVIINTEHKLFHYKINCFDIWRRYNALYYVVVKIQTAWREYQQKGNVKYEDMQEIYASWSIHLKKMRKMEEIFKSIFLRTHRMAFKWFIIKLANYASNFGKPGSPYRATQVFNQYDTVLQANVAFRIAKLNYVKYLLLTIINNRQEKESLLVKNYFNLMRRNAKLKRLVMNVIKIQKMFKAKRSTLKFKGMLRSKTKLNQMFRKSFLNRVIRMLKIIKLTFYEFFMANDYAPDKEGLNTCIELVNNIRLVFAKSFYKNMLGYDRMHQKLIFIQVYWKIKLRLIKNRRIREILKSFSLMKIRNNKRVFYRAFDKWLNNSLMLTINLAVEVLTKFLYNNYILKKRFRKLLRRLIIKRMVREFTQCFIFGKNKNYRR